MDRDKMKEEIAKMLDEIRDEYCLPDHESRLVYSDKILSLLAPVIEKAEKWDRIVDTTNPAHLYALAEWIDLKYPNDSNPEVQADLRRLADALTEKEST